MVIVIMILLSGLSAADFTAEQPILITTAGQSADILMVKLLAQKAGLTYTMDKLATPESLTEFKSIVIVSGGSTKGLGAAKIDKDDEIKRVETLISAAMDKKIPIITMHIGGKSRRGSLSDEFNSVAAPAADCLIVVETGDFDGYFSAIAEENKIPIERIDKIISAQTVLEAIFNPASE